MDFKMGGPESGFQKVFNPKEKRYIKLAVGLVIGLILILSLVFTSYFTVNDKQQGVVSTFGKVTGIVDAGIHFKLPFGIQTVQLVDSNIYQKIEIGYYTAENGVVTPVSGESKMITGDFNIVNVDFFVEFKISDPVKYLYSSENPEGILKSLTQSQIRSVISSYNVDSILTAGKSEIQATVKDFITRELEEYDIGLILTEIKIQDAEPPTKEVVEAFKSVETARQNQQSAINEAKAYENSNIPIARSNRDQLIKNAEYLKQNRINDAVKQVAMFEAMYAEYKLNPEITRQRMYFEAIEKILPGVKLYINTGGSGDDLSMILPLESFITDGK